MPRMIYGSLRRHHLIFFVYTLLICFVGQAILTAANGDVGLASTSGRLIALRDTFIARIKIDGFACPIPPPTIVLDHTPSFGNYDDATNLLHIADWSMLSLEERELFVHLAGPGADENAAHAKFEEVAHHWIFIHELGHWWQACRHANPTHTNYQIEYGANRVAIAYWRETDASFADRMLALFYGFVDHSPSPVPKGEAIEPYFNTHYEQLGPTPAYRWYQSHMIVEASQEKPAPSFATALLQTKP